VFLVFKGVSMFWGGSAVLGCTPWQSCDVVMDSITLGAADLPVLPGAYMMLCVL
jgi:hypothetical protein